MEIFNMLNILTVDHSKLLNFLANYWLKAYDNFANDKDFDENTLTKFVGKADAVL